MKILRLIDRYVDSFEKRIFIFVIFITMYWLWQNIWQLLLFYLLIYNRVVDKMKVVYPFYESVIIKKPKKVNV